MIELVRSITGCEKNNRNLVSDRNYGRFRAELKIGRKTPQPKQSDRSAQRLRLGQDRLMPIIYRLYYYNITIIYLPIL